MTDETTEPPTDAARPKRVLFLCTGNSCRSQMAEAILRDRGGSRVESLSAGAKPSGYIHDGAVRATQELGLSVDGQRSKSIDEFLPPQGSPPDLIISVCSNADRDCPVFPADVERWHWPFDDPADATGTDEEIQAEFRRVRDEIVAKLDENLDAVLATPATDG